MGDFREFFCNGCDRSYRVAGTVKSGSVPIVVADWIKQQWETGNDIPMVTERVAKELIA